MSLDRAWLDDSDMRRRRWTKASRWAVGIYCALYLFAFERAMCSDCSSELYGRLLLVITLPLSLIPGLGLVLGAAFNCWVLYDMFGGAPQEPDRDLERYRPRPWWR